MNTFIIDADTHLTEPPDLWTSRVPQRYVEHVPHVVRDDGRDVWMLGGVRISTVGLVTTAGWDAFPPDPPKTFEECHPGAYDAHARLRYMDEAGIWAQVLYPNVAGFGSQRFVKFFPDPELRLLCVRAYNDFLQEWTSADPRRLITVISLPFWDVDAAVAEVERCADKGFRGILFTGEPQKLSLPVLGSPHWDPLWSVAQAAGLPVHFHIASGEESTGLTPERIATVGMAGTNAWLATSMIMGTAGQVADLITCGLLARYTDLKFVTVESGIGWIPTVLEMADHMYLEWDPDVEVRPSELFRRQVYSTHWFERVAPPQIVQGHIPIDNVMFETDFPHSSCIYGKRQITETIDRNLAPFREADRRKILWDNAARLYHIDTPAEVPVAS